MKNRKLYDYKGNLIDCHYQPDEDGMITVWDIDDINGKTIIIRDYKKMRQLINNILDNSLPKMNHESRISIDFYLLKITPNKWKTFSELPEDKQKRYMLSNINNDGAINA